MTKEELEKEAEGIYQKTDKEFMDCQDEGEIFNLGYLAGAEPREKRIAELEKENAELEAEVKEWKDKADLWCKTANLKDHNIMINKELEKENADLKEEINKIAFARGNLEEENAELKEQIEKMKCGDNCKYGCMACGSYLCDLGLDGCNEIPFNCDKWELKEDVL